MTKFKFFLLGSPQIELAGERVDINRRKALALLIYLAVTGQAHSRDVLATLFYPDHSQSRARAYLRRDLAMLNASLKGNWLIADWETVAFKRDDQVWLDLEQFRYYLATCQSHDHAPQLPCAECLPLLTAAVDLYKDDFLAGFSLRDCTEFDEWQFFQAESLRQELATALERLVSGCSQQGNLEAAIPYARRWLALDPLHDPAQRVLIQLYDKAGQPSAAMRQYEEYTALLEAELGLPPEEETTTLYEAVKAKRLLGPHLRETRPNSNTSAKLPNPVRARSPVSNLQTSSPAILAEPQTAGLAPLRPWAGQDPIPAVPEKPQIVGREIELGKLHDWLDTALQGKRQFVFITGEAGQGKTTLLAAFLEQARAKTTLWIGHGQCLEQRGAPEAYMPVLAALSRLCQEQEGQTLISLLDKVAPTWLVQMPGLVEAQAYERLQQKVESATPGRMLRELVEVIEVITVQRPLVLVLEDLHWSDYSTLDLLTALAQRQESARLLLIGTYRPADVTQKSHPLLSVVQSMQLLGQGMELPLPGLSEAAVQAYLAQRFSYTDWPADLAHLLYQRTEGHPLFMRAVLDAWVAQGALVKQNGQWSRPTELDSLALGLPSNLRRWIELQLTQLDNEGQQILAAGSVEGVNFSAAAVAAAVTLPEEEIEKRGEALVQQGQFLDAGRLTEWPDGTVSASFEFRHQLYQEVLYEQISAARRARLHRQIGERLEAGYGSQAAGKATELARHFIQGRDPGRAVTYLRLAAEQSMRRNAYREAIEQLSHALELLQRYPDLPERDQHELALQLLLGPALILTRGWASVEAEQAYVRARELGQQLKEMRQLSLALYGLATLRELRGEYAKSQALLEERLQLPHELHDQRLRIESHELLACSTFHQGAFVQALNHADQALALGQPGEGEPLTPLLGEDPAISSYHWAGLSLWFLGYPDQALARSQKALHQTKDLVYTFSLAHAQQQAAMIHHLRREVQAVEERAENTIDAAAKGGFTYWVGVGKILRGWAITLQRQAETGLALITEGLQICQTTGTTIDHPYFLSILADACGHAGRIEAGLAALAEAVQLVRRSRNFFYEAELHRLRGVLLWQANAGGNLAEAEAAYQRALAVAREQQARSLELRAVISLSRLWRQQGKTNEARALLAATYDWFSEGFETADLREAAALLEALGAEVPPGSALRPAFQRFLPEQLIATGGMGEVYRGRDLQTNRPVAIKRLKPELAAQNPAAVQRLIREGEILGQLNHPNIVKILASYEQDQQPVIVMEYISGGTLGDLLKREGQLELAQVLNLSLELADALVRVHHLGILHRDLKPANILLAEDGTPRLTDFGVAYLAWRETRLTQAGAILGTTVYLSPEAWRGEELNMSSDVWSFGSVLYEMLAGRPPFAAESVIAIMTAILNDPPPDLRTFRPDTPPALVELIKHMLVKDRTLRIDSMRQVAAALEVIQRSLA
jgi:DNA-binding SARP family transcriptional activator/predicted ATPase/predicted Ser/Thr protein kinase